MLSAHQFPAASFLLPWPDASPASCPIQWKPPIRHPCHHRFRSLLVLEVGAASELPPQPSPSWPLTYSSPWVRSPQLGPGLRLLWAQPWPCPWPLARPLALAQLPLPYPWLWPPPWALVQQPSHRPSPLEQHLPWPWPLGLAQAPVLTAPQRLLRSPSDWHACEQTWRVLRGRTSR